MVAIDPGLRGCGAALFIDGLLAKADYVTCPTKLTRGYAAHALMAANLRLWVHEAAGSTTWFDTFVVELPRIYPHAAQQKGDSNDLLDVAAVGAAFMGISYFDLKSADDASILLQHMVSVFPAEWKGQVPKDVMNRRVLAKLTEEERGLVGDAGAKTHNTLDAVGIGLHYLGRI